MRLRAATLLAVLLSACGTDRVSGGNGTSTDNVVTARILSIDSISARQPSGDSGPYVMLVHIDSSTLDFGSALPDGRDLRVDGDSGPLPFQLREWDQTNRQASLWVRLPRLQPGAGKHLTVRVNQDSLISRSNASETWSGVSDSVKQRVASILLSDFESYGLIVGTPCGCNAWYASHSSLGAVNRYSSGIDSAGKGRPGKAYHLSYSATSPEWALLGTRLGDNLLYPAYRFGVLDSITLWVRGNGIIRVALEDGRDPSTLSKAWTSIIPDPNAWKRVKITPAEFELPGPYSWGWENVKNRVNTFTIFAQDGSDVWIDNIRLYGISPSEIP